MLPAGWRFALRLARKPDPPRVRRRVRPVRAERPRPARWRVTRYSRGR